MVIYFVVKEFPVYVPESTDVDYGAVECGAISMNSDPDVRSVFIRWTWLHWMDYLPLHVQSRLWKAIWCQIWSLHLQDMKQESGKWGNKEKIFKTRSKGRILTSSFELCSTAVLCYWETEDQQTDEKRKEKGRHVLSATDWLTHPHTH